LHAVVQGVARGEDQHRQRQAARADVARQRQTVAAGQADVEDGGVEGVALQHLLGALGAAHPIDGIAGVGEAQLDAAGDHEVVFDQEQTHVVNPLRGEVWGLS
jgi:hypothetical protein